MAGVGSYRGRAVEKVSRIVGSVGRRREFGHRFVPTKAGGARWKRVDLAFHRFRDLPPVCLFKIGVDYFVYDGTHRVSEFLDDVSKDLLPIVGFQGG